MLQHTTTRSNTLQHTATHGNTLQHTATHCNTRQHTATHCNTLQHTATRCNTLPHTATHCHTLQHTATHCNTLQHTTALQVGHHSLFTYSGYQNTSPKPPLKNKKWIILTMIFHNPIFSPLSFHVKQNHGFFFLNQNKFTIILTWIFFPPPSISRDAGYQRVFRGVAGPQIEGGEGLLGGWGDFAFVAGVKDVVDDLVIYFSFAHVQSKGLFTHTNNPVHLFFPPFFSPLPL